MMQLSSSLHVIVVNFYVVCCVCQTELVVVTELLFVLVLMCCQIYCSFLKLLLLLLFFVRYSSFCFWELCNLILEVKLSYDPVFPSVDRLIIISWKARKLHIHAHIRALFRYALHKGIDTVCICITMQLCFCLFCSNVWTSKRELQKTIKQ